MIQDTCYPRDLQGDAPTNLADSPGSAAPPAATPEDMGLRGWDDQPAFRSWTKLPRDLIDHAVFQQPALLQVYLLCLVRAADRERTIPWRVGGQKTTLTIAANQFVTSRHALAELLHVPASTARERLLKLQEMGLVAVCSNKLCTRITVCRDGDKLPVFHDHRQPLDRRPTTTRPGTDTNKKQEKMNNNQKIAAGLKGSSSEDSRLRHRAERHTRHCIQVSHQQGRNWDRKTVLKIMSKLCRTHDDDTISFQIQTVGPRAETPGLIRTAVLNQPTAEKKAAAAKTAEDATQRILHERDQWAKAAVVTKYPAEHRRRMQEIMATVASRRSVVPGGVREANC